MGAEHHGVQPLIMIPEMQPFAHRSSREIGEWRVGARDAQDGGGLAGIAGRLSGWGDTAATRRWWLPARLQRLALRSVLKTSLIFLPTLLAILYFGLIATDRYVSEARFILRTASKPANAMGGLNALMQLAGMSRSQDDSYAVRDFLTSRDALAQLAARVDLRPIFDRPGADFIARYPSPLFGGSQESFYRYFQWMLSVVVNETSGLTILRVQAFRAEDAQLLARQMLALGEDMVNRLNARMQADTVRVAKAEVASAEERRIRNQIEITAFRNRELILDPEKTSSIVVTLIGKLAVELAGVRAQIDAMRSNSPNSPQLQSLRAQAAALEQQIALERGRVASDSDGLADKVAVYERLMLQRTFAIRALAQAVAALETAQLDAERQQLFLETVVRPDLPDKAMMPHRWGMVLTVFGFNLIGALVLWLIASGLSEHGAGSRLE